MDYKKLPKDRKKPLTNDKKPPKDHKKLLINNEKLHINRKKRLQYPIGRAVYFILK
jgi:hypothetical protein